MSIKDQQQWDLIDDIYKGIILGKTCTALNKGSISKHRGVLFKQRTVNFLGCDISHDSNDEEDNFHNSFFEPLDDDCPSQDHIILAYLTNRKQQPVGPLHHLFSMTSIFDNNITPVITSTSKGDKLIVNGKRYRQIN